MVFRVAHSDIKTRAAADALYAEVSPRLPWNPLLTVAEAAEKLGCDEATIRAMLWHGILRGEESAGEQARMLIPLAEIERLQR